MSEKSEERKPLKLKLSSSKKQLDQPLTPAPDFKTNEPAKPQDRLANEAPLSAADPATTERLNPVAPPAVEPPPHPTAAIATPPPLPKKSQAQASAVPPPPPQNHQPARSQQPPRHNENRVPYEPSKKKEDSNILGSLLIIALLLLILSAAGGGIWYVLSIDKSTTSDETESSITDSISPIQRAKDAIEKVPVEALDQVLETDSSAMPPSGPEVIVVEEETVPTAPENLTESVSDFLGNIRIGAMRTGASARVMINDVYYSINDTVDPTTGLVFIGTRDKKLRFKDRNGIIYVKSF